MAGFVPGLLPTNHSQEKEFAQAYEDVLERYKGKWDASSNPFFSWISPDITGCISGKLCHKLTKSQDEVI